MIKKNNLDKLKEISILDFPKNIFIKLPDQYRKILFQLIFLKFNGAKNVIGYLKKNNLRENVFRWRRGYDREFPQFINLESLISLYGELKNLRNDIEGKTKTIKLKKCDKRIEKTEELISLIKYVRLILKGNKNLAKVLNVNPGTLCHYILNKKIKNLPINLIEKLLKFIDDKILCYSFTIEELQNKIISYRAYHGKVIMPEFMDKRLLTIKITPEFESILFHLFGDGHVKQIGSGEYTQLNEKGRTNFLNKLYNNFGYFKITKKSFDNGRVIIPKAIILILCKYYNLNYKSFNWNISELPSNLSFNDEFKIAGLSAFIVDEGHVGNRGIEIYSSNKKLLSQIKNIAINLELECSEIKNKKPCGNTKESFRFRIKKESSIRFIKMVKRLKKRYPFVGLAHKEKILN